MVVGVTCGFLVEISTETVRSVLIGVERIGWKIRATEEIVEVLSFCLLSYSSILTYVMLGHLGHKLLISGNIKWCIIFMSNIYISYTIYY